MDYFPELILLMILMPHYNWAILTCVPELHAGTAELYWPVSLSSMWVQLSYTDLCLWAPCWWWTWCYSTLQLSYTDLCPWAPCWWWTWCYTTAELYWPVSLSSMRVQLSYTDLCPWAPCWWWTWCYTTAELCWPVSLSSMLVVNLMPASPWAQSAELPLAMYSRQGIQPT